MNTCNPVKNNSSTNELVSFLKNSNTQYKTLSKKEERDLIERLHKTDEDQLRNLLVMHNLRYVFNLAKKYAQQTVDFDNLIAKGLYGLVIASKKFNFFLPITKEIPALDENGVQKIQKVPVMKKDSDGNQVQARNSKGEPLFKETPMTQTVIVYESDGKTPKYVKFNTYATSWILKYIRKEFNDEKELTFTRNCISINDVPRIKNSDGNETMENYIDNMISPDVQPKTINDEISAVEMTDVCKSIYDYVDSDTQLSATEKQIFFDSFMNNKKTKDIAEELGSNMTTVINKKKKVLDRVRSMLVSKMNIRSINDILV